MAKDGLIITRLVVDDDFCKAEVAAQLLGISKESFLRGVREGEFPKPYSPPAVPGTKPAPTPPDPQWDAHTIGAVALDRGLDIFVWCGDCWQYLPRTWFNHRDASPNKLQPRCKGCNRVRIKEDAVIRNKGRIERVVDCYCLIQEVLPLIPADLIKNFNSRIAETLAEQVRIINKHTMAILREELDLEENIKGSIKNKRKHEARKKLDKKIALARRDMIFGKPKAKPGTAKQAADKPSVKTPVESAEADEKKRRSGLFGNKEDGGTWV